MVVIPIEYHSTFGVRTNNMVDQRTAIIALHFSSTSNVTFAKNINVDRQIVWKVVSAIRRGETQGVVIAVADDKGN